MQDFAYIQTLIELFEDLEKTTKPADSFLSAEFRSKRYIGSKDRKVIANRFYRILRCEARLSWWAKKMNFQPRPRIKIIFDEIFHENHKTPDEVIELFNGERFGPEKMKGSEREIVHRMMGQSINHEEMDEKTRFECPDWAYGRLKEIFETSENFAKEMDEMLEPAELHLRVNVLKGDVDAAQSALAKEGIKSVKGELSPISLIVDGRPALGGSKAFQDGLVEIQDSGSQLIALLTGVKPGDRVSDFCSGAGGKALAMGAQMDNKGSLIASDVLAGKLRRAKTRFKRAGLDNIETRPLSSERDKWVKRAKGTFDVVLTDAPCSGTGTWKRNPDMRWRFLGPNMKELTDLQASILESASRLVKAGGQLIYATCSLLPEENQDQIHKFLEKNTEFELVPVSEIWESRVGTPNPGFTDMMDLTPAMSGTDGFFAAVMRRKS